MYAVIQVYDNGNELNDISHITRLFTTREQAQRELDEWKEEDIEYFGSNNVYADKNCLRDRATDEIIERFLIIEFDEQEWKMGKDFDNYIVFLLGTDNFEISKEIRHLAEEFGMDGIYEDCVYIAQQFEKYDKNNYNTTSQYESLEKFLATYDTEIKEFLHNRTKFEI